MRTKKNQHTWDESMAYVKTFVDIKNEPFLILDKNLRVIVGNGLYYETFKVEEKDVERRSVYEIGKGQWNLPRLRLYLDGVATNGTFFKGFEITNKFKDIGVRTMMINGRRIYKGISKVSSKTPPSMVLFAMEDITDIIMAAKKIVNGVSHNA